jgi:hypothetical protein
MIDLIRNYPPAIAWLDEIRAQGEKVSLPGFVVMELIQGCRNAEEIKRVEKDVRNYVTRWPSRATCKRSLTAYTKYHQSHGLGIIDSLIGQIALRGNLQDHHNTALQETVIVVGEGTSEARIASSF